METRIKSQLDYEVDLARLKRVDPGDGMGEGYETTYSPGELIVVLAQIGWQNGLRPLPGRLVASAQANGVPIQLVDDATGSSGGIDPVLYGDTVRLCNAHPASVAHLEAFEHDSNDTHPIPAGLGRGEAIELLVPPRQLVRKSGPLRVADAYDKSTFQVRNGVKAYLKRLAEGSAEGHITTLSTFERVVGCGPREAEKRRAKMDGLMREGLERLEIL